MNGSRASTRRAPGSTTHDLADQAFARAAGTPLVAGNCVRILKDAEEKYPAWLEVIRSARRTIHFESTASLLIGLALVAFLWPRVIAIPLAVISAWCAVSLAIKAHRLRVRFGQSGKT
jgi:hypothetical protein